MNEEILQDRSVKDNLVSVHGAVIGGHRLIVGFLEKRWFVTSPIRCKILRCRAQFTQIKYTEKAILYIFIFVSRFFWCVLCQSTTQNLEKMVL